MPSEDDARHIALSLPETTEKPSYGTPGFRVRDRLFARVHDLPDTLVVWVSDMDEKEALREEVRLADDFAKQLGRRNCSELAHHRERIGIAVAEFVEPQIEDLLADLDRELDSPGWLG